MSSNIRLKRICKQCGNEFVAKTTVTQFCSAACVKRNYKARLRQAKIDCSEAETAAIRQKPIEEIKAKEFLSMDEVCKLLGVSRWTLHRAITRGAIPSAKLGKRRIIKRANIEKIFESEGQAKI